MIHIIYQSVRAGAGERTWTFLSVRLMVPWKMIQLQKKEMQQRNKKDTKKVSFSENA